MESAEQFSGEEFSSTSCFIIILSQYEATHVEANDINCSQKYLNGNVGDFRDFKKKNKLGRSGLFYYSGLLYTLQLYMTGNFQVVNSH